MKNPLKEVTSKVQSTNYFERRKKFVPGTNEVYFSFCRKNGLGQTNRKSIVALKKERKLYIEQSVRTKEKALEDKLEKASREKKKMKKISRSTIKEILSNESLSYRMSHLAKTYKNLCDEHLGEVFIDLIMIFKNQWAKLNKKEDLFFKYAGRRPLVWTVLENLARVQGDWIRPLEDFDKKGHNVHKRLLELVEHLLVKNNIPKGIHSLMVSDKSEAINYFVKVAGGSSPKTGIPSLIGIPKSKASLLMRKLSRYEWAEAVRRTQWDWMRIEKRLQETLWRIADFREEGAEDDKKEFVNFIAQQGMLNMDVVGPLWDFVRHAKAEARQAGRDYTLKGRSIFNLIDSMDAWHRELYESSDMKNNFTWDPSDYSPYEEIRKKDDVEYKIYVRELTSKALLSKEGRKQKHCVGSYARSCKGGNTSIWSLREEIAGNVDILATIEVRNGTIVQAKAACNKRISTQARAIMERWASKNALDVRV